MRWLTWRATFARPYLGDEHGMVSLFQYPAHKGCAARTFGGHSSKVTGVRFMFDDTYLISVGADMTICQWRVVL